MGSTKKMYLQLRHEARKIVEKQAAPEFYTDFPDQVTASRKMLDEHRVLIRLAKQISPVLDDDFGHGMLHCRLVGEDAGALVQIEMSKNSKEQASAEDVKKNMLLVQTAALLHDIKRKEKHHSEKGAVFAKEFLKKENYPFSSEEISLITHAIREHEAFKKNSSASKSDKASLISDALYDADKFRWGPDNFTHTVWDMVIYSNISLDEFIQRYPNGMKKLSQIKETFRTDTGKIYGPDFIRLGIEAGEILFKIIEDNYL
ncbi:MAG: HD domain-containing protein [Thermodesulfobacteriota bacterium]|nr:HD domain-containing protein [Thermodesulfobacteriota bacterium]